MRRAIFVAVLALSTGFVAACGGSKAGKVDYSVSAQQNYERGLKKMEREDWVAAAKYFSFIKARFPYSKYAVLAELRLADAEFGAEHYLQAVDLFKSFIKFHPSHEMVRNGYASFRIAGAYYEMLPGDMWLLPPSFEKDQSATSDAHRELVEFLRKYPGSPQMAKVRVMLTRINKRLAAHELYVARFYWDRERPMGTVLRLRRLLDKHGGVGYDGPALYLLGKAYLEVDEPARARKAWERLVKEHPDDDHADEVRDELKKLPG
ncbi:MAG TPA: outer membrane protein assembly factor BamD [Kofleriaceae bacterium]|nr:outer membrane protein assembly factor BamD [Kofleriaceae bacterium]